MYLSRLLLNPRSRQVQRETADPYNLHKTIMQAFDPKRDQAGVLHRIEVDGRTGAILLLVQSTAKPDWSTLAEKDYLLPADPFSNLENPAVKQFSLPLQAGQTLRFRLVANPTVKKKREGKKNSNRVPLVREERQLTWLQGKGEQHGFQPLQIATSAQAEHKSWRKKGQPPLTLYTVQFDGRLQITDANKFTTAVQTGIGPAKAFGCGLLSLAPG
ncbi:MAG: type I-E CRISPR-associated protein Cas6/Cse3/CasE [Anaerolineaceae bacterium]|nr:type I-E CRISPR-associated protein Cas6/Cse3/CasE [Anaerolineaceae bacterium]